MTKKDIEQQPLQRTEKKKGRSVSVTLIARFWALITIGVMWTAGIKTVQNHETHTYVGWYLIAISIVVTLLEMTWYLDKVKCCGERGCCLCWRVIMWVDFWKRGILYICLSLPVFMGGMIIILGIVSGVFLVICACLYIAMSFKYDGYKETKEVHYVTTGSPKVDLITHEMACQTEDDAYYREVAASSTVAGH